MISFTINETFFTDFLGATKALKLKLSTYMDKGLMYHVYQNQGQGPITLGVTPHPLIGITICH